MRHLYRLTGNRHTVIADPFKFADHAQDCRHLAQMPGARHMYSDKNVAKLVDFVMEAIDQFVTDNCLICEFFVASEN